MTYSIAEKVARLLDADRLEHEAEDAKRAPFVLPPVVLTEAQIAAMDETAGLD